ncbi:(2Fe-2S)-binding protein [Leisingera caerulea]|uniref:(2Fe-2S)-binding protein n=1 Tax=Leisingera caerulea TaxID=506591 RepID=UPI0021A60DFC|nr:(2Fe-2S)-binding protein [Leisingera caerulea]UWQ85995.1 (2Fe-2S)-binding protein [Leisingera caerulea]
MKIDSRFLTRPDPGATVQLTLDGVPIMARVGDTVAAALLAHSGDPSRQSANNAPRTAYCMMGVCFDCLVEVDGLPNSQGCMIQVRDGMVLRRQVGLRKLSGGAQDA